MSLKGCVSDLALIVLFFPPWHGLKSQCCTVQKVHYLVWWFHKLPLANINSGHFWWLITLRLQEPSFFDHLGAAAKMSPRHLFKLIRGTHLLFAHSAVTEKHLHSHGVMFPAAWQMYVQCSLSFSSVFRSRPTPEGNIWLSYELLHVCCLVPSGVANSRFLELETAVGCDASRARWANQNGEVVGRRVKQWVETHCKAERITQT